METVTSTDGTTIAYERRGDGPPVVLVHGTTGSRRTWEPFHPRLDGRATVALDRRGRGASGDGDEYGLQREVADLRAVVDSFDGNPAVFGHSFGGLVALEAAREVAIDRLVLYEPAVLTGQHREGADLAAEMQTLLDADEPREAVELFFREAVGTDALDAVPVAESVPIADTVVRENRVVERYRLDETLDVRVPTLVLTGDRSPDHLRDAARAVRDALPDARLAELDGVGHVGVSSAPERVASEVRPFLREE